jgi:hypothetical protein
MFLSNKGINYQEWIIFLIIVKKATDIDPLK